MWNDLPSAVFDTCAAGSDGNIVQQVFKFGLEDLHRNVTSR